MEMRQRAAEGLRVGDRFTIRRCFSPDDIAAFAALSRDFNPVHCDQGYIDVKGLGEPIAHGLLTASMITEIGGQIGWLAASMNFRFKRPVYAGEILTCEWVVLTIDERLRATAEIRITSGDGQVALEAETRGVVPGPQERQRLKDMLAEGDPSNGRTTGLE